LWLLYDFLPVFRIRIRRIRMFLGLSDPHPDPLDWGTDPRIRGSRSEKCCYRLVTCLSPRPCRLCLCWRAAPCPCRAPPPPGSSRSGTSCSFWGSGENYIFRNRRADDGNLLQRASQCCGSGSGSICLWASQIWIHYGSQEIRIRILLSSSKNSKKNIDFLLFCDFCMTFYLWKMMYIYLKKVINKIK
jgi:hypothetical protein